MIYFEYEKIDERYQINKHILNQIIYKALSIMEILYLRYELLFIIANIINYSIFIKDIL